MPKIVRFHETGPMSRSEEVREAHGEVAVLLEDHKHILVIDVAEPLALDLQAEMIPEPVMCRK